VARPRHPWTSRTTAAFAYAAVGWTLAIGLLLLVMPASYDVTTSSSKDGATLRQTSTITVAWPIREQEAPVIGAILLTPVLLTLVGALARGRRRRMIRLGTGGVLLAACLLGLASLGIFYLPAAILLVGAGLKTDGADPDPAPPFIPAT
jgi:hypothetical protein